MAKRKNQPTPQPEPEVRAAKRLGRPPGRKSGVRKIKVSKMGRKPPPENETRHDRFMRIGTKRMNNAIRQIQLLGNLCSPNYECDANDLALMRDAIVHELDMALARFTPRKRQGAEPAFSFKQTKSPSLVTSH